MSIDKHGIKADGVINISFIILSCLPHIYSRTPVSSWILLIIIFSICLIQTIQHKLWVNSSIIAWWIYLLIIALGCMYTNDISYALGYVIKIFILILSLNYIPQSEHFYRFIKVFGICVFISIASIVAEVFFPNIISNIRSILITNSSNATLVSVTFIQAKIAAFSSKYGFFSDTAVGAFYCAVGLSIGIYYYAYDKTKKTTAYLWMIISVIGIILTNKRGPMLSIVFASAILFLIKSSYSRSAKIKAIVLLIIISGIGTYLFNTNELLLGWMSRINSNIYSTRNRLYIYTSLWENFLHHPIIGSGTKSTKILLGGMDGHNIYLASLSENGAIGSIAFVSALALSIKDSVIILRLSQESNNKYVESVVTLCLFIQLYICSYGMTGNPFSNLFSLTMYFMSVGIPIRMQRIYELGLMKEE